ncbi:MAG: DUF1730 domain-containing protein [Muribaculaceae bacterium]|nr:DUF1730 domain-containing protein [Muribaculaceae bacterium]
MGDGEMGRDSGRLRKETLTAALREAGALRVGYAQAGPVEDAETRRFEAWLAAGKYAGMDYMLRHADVRRDPRLLLAGARTIVSMAFSYRCAGDERPAGVAEYALSPDYHDTIRRRIRESRIPTLLGEEIKDWRLCIDSAPIHERYWARKAGVGRIGEHGGIVVPGVGSEVLLAEIITTLELDPDEPLEGDCGRCGRCRSACPTKANADGATDCNRCLSYLTIEHRGPWTDRRHEEAMSSPGGTETLFGCDRCMRVCPHNNPECNTGVPPHESMRRLTAGEIAGMTSGQFSARFRGMPVKRAKFDGLMRNAINILNKSGNII